MYIKTIKCEDFNGDMQTYNLYFNLTKKELLKMDANIEGGMLNYLNKLRDEKNAKDMMNFIDILIDASYGVKSDDGKKFIKNDDVLDDFKSSPAYDEYYYQLLTAEGEADKFIDKVFPRDLMAQALDEIKKNPKLAEEAGINKADISGLIGESNE